MKNPAERLKHCRELAGDLSARELGRLANLSEHYPGMIESGTRKSPTPRVLVPLAEVLGCSPEWLILGLGRPPSERTVKNAVARARDVQASGDAA